MAVGKRGCQFRVRVLEKKFTVTFDEIYLPFLVNKQSEKSLVTFVEVVKLYITIEEKILCWKAFEKHGVLFQVLTKVSQLSGSYARVVTFGSSFIMLVSCRIYEVYKKPCFTYVLFVDPSSRSFIRAPLRLAQPLHLKVLKCQTFVLNNVLHLVCLAYLWNDNEPNQRCVSISFILTRRCLVPSVNHSTVKRRQGILLRYASSRLVTLQLLSRTSPTDTQYLMIPVH